MATDADSPGASASRDGSLIPRIPFVDSDTQEPALRALFDQIRARGAEPFNIHRTIAQAPDIFAGFLSFAFALRSQAVSPRVDRELMILRTCQLTDGSYQWSHHRHMAAALGLTDIQIDQIATWRTSDAFSPSHRAILAYTDAMFSAAGVDEAVFGDLARRFGPREIVELTLTAAFYGGMAHFSRALRIPLDADASTGQYGRT